MDLTITSSATMPAPPDRVYKVIADYRNGHPRILPDAFKSLTVEKGGVGAGTVIAFEMRVLGKTQKFRAEISEPEPGRVLVEKNIGGNDAVTTFTVERAGASTLVTISTEMRTAREGLLGRIERAMTKRILAPLYDEELKKLARVSESGAA